LFERSDRTDLKVLLYVFRVLMTGIHLMRTGEVEANLVRLNGEFRIPYIDELIEVKRTQGEHATLADGNLERFHAGRERLSGELQEASAASDLPDEPAAFDALNDFVVRLRLAN
jgi:uncharacterized protein